MAIAALPRLASDKENSIAASCSTRIGSLVFDLEGDEPKPRGGSNKAQIAAAKERIAALARPAMPFTSQLQRDVRFFQSQSEDADMCVQLDSMSPVALDSVLLASKLSSIGYRVSVRSALGGGAATAPHQPGACFSSLRHEFLLVRNDAAATEAGGDGEVVVDPHFREQFEIPQPTAAYAEILTEVPRTFVGPISRLVPIVQLLGAEMADSFRAKGLTLPPWRKTQSVLSKWMPAKAKDLPFDERGLLTGGGAGSLDPMLAPLPAPRLPLPRGHAAAGLISTRLGQQAGDQGGAPPTPVAGHRHHHVPFKSSQQQQQAGSAPKHGHMVKVGFFV